MPIVVVKARYWYTATMVSEAHGVGGEGGINGRRRRRKNQKGPRANPMNNVIQLYYIGAAGERRRMMSAGL